MTPSNATEGIVTAGQGRPNKSDTIKRCPECFTNLPFETIVCPWCFQKIRNKIDKHGYAKKTTDWRAYLVCFITWTVAGLYIWWAFLRE